jgi:hypothetical protein
MKIQKMICLLVVVLLLTSNNYAYAQFWRKWFQKDQQTQSASSEQHETIKEEDISEKQITGEEIPTGMRVDIWTIGEPEDTPEQALKEVQAVPKAVPAAPAVSPTREIDEKQREEELRRTQEQVDQIRKIQEMNNMQRSLDNIRRINEQQRQQKRIEEINRLNRMQKNLDELRRATETKK